MDVQGSNDPRPKNGGGSVREIVRLARAAVGPGSGSARNDACVLTSVAEVGA